jgi:hypothetical protein
MMMQEYRAFCPFEIGDHVRLINAACNYSTKETFIINDILTISSIKKNNTIFKIILVDQYGNQVLERFVDDLILIKK